MLSCVCSVLMHLLPGLALFAHRYYTPAGLRGLQGLSAAAAALLQGRWPDVGQVPALQQAQPLVLWLVVAPLAFYIAWQLLYFLIVQVGLPVKGQKPNCCVSAVR